MKKVVLVLVAVLGLMTPLFAYANEADPTVLAVHFETDKSDLSPTDKASLDSLAESINRDKLQVVITGHADKRASRLYNLDLGERRAKTVADYLASKGVSKTLIAVSYGEEKPKAPNDSDVHHLAFNRRADILVVKPEVTVKTIIRVDRLYIPVKAEPKKNRLTVLGGVGPQGVNKTKLAPNKFLVDQGFNPVAGLAYSRLLGKNISLTVQAFSNVSGFLGVGLDF